MQRTTPGENKYAVILRGTTLLALSACLLIPGIAQAQDSGSGQGTGSKSGNPAAGLADKKVTVDADTMKLSEVLPPLMKSVGADFVIDNTLKNATVTVHLNNVRFQAALDTIVKVCSEPISYKLEDGVYHFVPGAAPEEPAPAPDPSVRPQGPTYKVGKIMVKNTDAQELVDFLTGDPNALSSEGLISTKGEITGSRSYSSSTFLNGHNSSSSYSAPITSGNNNGFSGGTYRNSNFGPGISFGPFGWSAGGGFRVGPYNLGGHNR